MTPPLDADGTWRMLAIVVLCLATVAWLAISLAWERRAHRATRAALARERATVDAARVLYGEARLREAARMVAVREMADD